jgi:acyl-CoA thioesterase I
MLLMFKVTSFALFPALPAVSLACLLSFPVAASPQSGASSLAQSNGTQASVPAHTAPQATSQARNAREEQLLTDWPDLNRYRSDDEKLAPPAPGMDRVVFMGDSITESWSWNGESPKPQTADSFFPGKPYINRGISGQTTPQMLVRFRQDVIALRPRVVVILAGTNDIAGNTGPTTLAAIENNLASMTDLAVSNGIRVVLCSVLPAYDYPWRPGLQPAQKIVALNTWIKSYADLRGLVYVDYYSAMVDKRGGLPPALSKDGVHPNGAGFAKMRPLVEDGIAQALAKN